jgi:hypothetical protein
MIAPCPGEHKDKTIPRGCIIHESTGQVAKFTAHYGFTFPVFPQTFDHPDCRSNGWCRLADS